MKIKTGDKVVMLSGKDKGKTGKILQVMTKEGRAVVEGLNLMIKHQKARRNGEKGQRIQFPSAIKSAKLGLVCPKCGQTTRVAYKITDGKKHRACAKCQEII